MNIIKCSTIPMENTALEYLKTMKIICNAYIKKLEDGGHEITPDIAETLSNIEKEIDIETNNIMETLLSIEHTKKSSKCNI